MYDNMKRLILILAAVVLSAIAASAQDVITNRNGEDILAKVLEIDTKNVKYRLFDEPDGVLYTIPKSQIILIRYESGRNEVFNTSSDQYYYNGYTREPVEGIHPGMKYKELKDIYSYSDWESGHGSRYSPALMGVCSWLIPGLGQMITGEVGRGFAWLGGAVGCTVLMGIGSGVSASAYYYDVDENYYVDTSKVLTGSLIVLASSLALLTVDICAIVDACRVAKVRNMYEQDLRAMKYSLELRPSVDYITMPGGIQPTAGLTLAMKF